MNLWKFWEENDKDILMLVQCAGTIATFAVAWSALNTWKRQLKGTAYFNTATRLQLLANRIRDTIIAERGNPAPLHWYNGIPNHDPSNIELVENQLHNERVYLREQLANCEALIEDLDNTVTEVDGILADEDVRLLTNNLKECLQHWNAALTVRYNTVHNCSNLRRYDDLNGRDTLNPILVLDERPESREYEESLRKATLVIAKAMQRFLR